MTATRSRKPSHMRTSKSLGAQGAASLNHHDPGLNHAPKDKCTTIGHSLANRVAQMPPSSIIRWWIPWPTLGKPLVITCWTGWLSLGLLRYSACPAITSWSSSITSLRIP